MTIQGEDRLTRDKNVHAEHLHAQHAPSARHRALLSHHLAPHEAGARSHIRWLRSRGVAQRAVHLEPGDGVNTLYQARLLGRAAHSHARSPCVHHTPVRTWRGSGQLARLLSDDCFKPNARLAGRVRPASGINASSGACAQSLVGAALRGGTHTPF